MAELNSTLTPLRRFIRLLEVDKKEITQVYLYAILSGLMSLSLPLGISAIINIIQSGELPTSWIVLVVFVLLGIVFAGGLTVMQLYLTESIQQRLFTRASMEFAYRIPRLQLDRIGDNYVPELVNRFFDTLNIQKGLPKILIDFSSAVIQILFGMLLLSVYHPFFIGFSIILVFIVYLILRLTGPRGLQTSLNESKYKYQVVHWLEEVGRTLRSFKMAGKTEYPTMKTDELTSSYLKARSNHFRILVIQYLNMVGFKVLVAAGLLIVGSILVIDQEINLGQFVAAEIIILLVMTSVEKLILTMETIYDVLTAVEKLSVITEVPLDKAGGIGCERKPHGFDIELRNVDFTYHDGTTPTLKNLNLHFKPNEKICLTGFNGSGKSTFLGLLSGLHLSYMGSLLVDNHSLDTLDIECFREQIGNSFVEEDVFRGTIEENITLGRENISREDVLVAVEKVRLMKFVKNQRHGIDTKIDPEGRSIPKNVVRKIILARAIALQSRLILLEDSLMQIEKGDRDHIIELLTNPEAPWTLVAVSNNSNIASKCSRVIALNEGEVIYDGNYEDMKKDECYNALYYA